MLCLMKTKSASTLTRKTTHDLLHCFTKTRTFRNEEEGARFLLIPISIDCTVSWSRKSANYHGMNSAKSAVL